MPLPAAEAHLMCAALVATDVAARALRLRIVLGGLGQALSLRRAAGIVFAGDAACALTPYRAGGDVARLVGLERAGVPRGRAVLALVSETIQTWPVLFGVVAVLMLWGGAAAWAPLVAAASAVTGRAWLVMFAVVVVAAGLAGGAARYVLRRFRPADGAPRSVRPPLRQLALTGPLTLVAIASRVLVLPVLAATLPTSPSLGTSLLGSFALLYSQLLLPMPAGAGAVDAGLLAGWHAARVLVYWRLYTSGIGLALGAAVSVKSGVQWLAPRLRRA